MKHKLIKLISIMLTITLLWQQTGLCDQDITTCLLRPVAMEERDVLTGPDRSKPKPRGFAYWKQLVEQHYVFYRPAENIHAVIEGYLQKQLGRAWDDFQQKGEYELHISRRGVRINSISLEGKMFPVPLDYLVKFNITKPDFGTRLDSVRRPFEVTVPAATDAGDLARILEELSDGRYEHIDDPSPEDEERLKRRYSRRYRKEARHREYVEARQNVNPYTPTSFILKRLHDALAICNLGHSHHVVTWITLFGIDICFGRLRHYDYRSDGTFGVLFPYVDFGRVGGWGELFSTKTLERIKDFFSVETLCEMGVLDFWKNLFSFGAVFEIFSIRLKFPRNLAQPRHEKASHWWIWKSVWRSTWFMIVAYLSLETIAIFLFGVNASACTNLILLFLLNCVAIRTTVILNKFGGIDHIRIGVTIKIGMNNTRIGGTYGEDYEEIVTLIENPGKFFRTMDKALDKLRRAMIWSVDLLYYSWVGDVLDNRRLGQVIGSIVTAPRRAWRWTRSWIWGVKAPGEEEKDIFLNLEAMDDDYILDNVYRKSVVGAVHEFNQYIAGFRIEGNRILRDHNFHGIRGIHFTAGAETMKWPWIQYHESEDGEGFHLELHVGKGFILVDQPTTALFLNALINSVRNRLEEMQPPMNPMALVDFLRNKDGALWENQLACTRHFLRENNIDFDFNSGQWRRQKDKRKGDRLRSFDALRNENRNNKGADEYFLLRHLQHFAYCCRAFGPMAVQAMFGEDPEGNTKGWHSFRWGNYVLFETMEGEGRDAKINAVVTTDNPDRELIHVIRDNEFMLAEAKTDEERDVMRVVRDGMLLQFSPAHNLNLSTSRHLIHNWWDCDAEFGVEAIGDSGLHRAAMYVPDIGELAQVEYFKTIHPETEEEVLIVSSVVLSNANYHGCQATTKLLDRLFNRIEPNVSLVAFLGQTEFGIDTFKTYSEVGALVPTGDIMIGKDSSIPLTIYRIKDNFYDRVTFKILETQGSREGDEEAPHREPVRHTLKDGYGNAPRQLTEMTNYSLGEVSISSWGGRELEGDPRNVEIEPLVYCDAETILGIDEHNYAHFETLAQYTETEARKARYRWRWVLEPITEQKKPSAPAANMILLDESFLKIIFPSDGQPSTHEKFIKNFPEGWLAPEAFRQGNRPEYSYVLYDRATDRAIGILVAERHEDTINMKLIYIRLAYDAVNIISRLCGNAEYFYKTKGVKQVRMEFWGFTWLIEALGKVGYEVIEYEGTDDSGSPVTFYECVKRLDEPEEDSAAKPEEKPEESAALDQI